MVMYHNDFTGSKKEWSQNSYSTDLVKGAQNLLTRAIPVVV